MPSTIGDTPTNPYDCTSRCTPGCWSTTPTGPSAPTSRTRSPAWTPRSPRASTPHELAAYCLALGDDALILSHRLSEWCSRAPDLEEDIALANIALDLLGQARLLLARAAAADPSLVPVLPEGSPVPAEDALAFFRDAHEFRNVCLVELPNGDFAETICRLLVFSTHRLALFQRLSSHPDAVLRAVAAKGVKELAYHRDFAGRWFVTLAQGTRSHGAGWRPGWSGCGPTATSSVTTPRPTWCWSTSWRPAASPSQTCGRSRPWAGTPSTSAAAGRDAGRRPCAPEGLW